MPSFDPTTGLPVLAPPGGNALQRSLVNNAIPAPAPPPGGALPLNVTQLQSIFNNLPPLVAPQPAATAAAPTPATTTPAAAKPPTQPIAPPATMGAVSPTPGAGNPLPPNMRAAATSNVPLPQGPMPTVQGDQGYVPDQGVTVIKGGQIMPPASGAIAPTYASTPAGGMMNPEGTINRGFDFQSQRTEHFMQQALDYINQGSDIFDRATRGRAIAGILAATMGPNNVGAVQGQGADSMNNALAGIQQAGIGANASEFASVAGMVNNQNTVNERRYEAETTPVDLGQGVQQVQYGNATIPMIVQQRGTRAGGLAATPIGAAAPNNAAPTLQQFLEKARAANPGVSDQQLQQYYARKYGGK